VRGGRHDVRVWNGVRIHAGRHEPGDVRHVDHEIGADRIGDLTEALEVEHA
jgi:hypothetical protein